MAAEAVVDASVIGAALFQEERTEAARAFLAGGCELLAPELLYAEVASLAAKKAWRGEASPEAGRRALQALNRIVTGWHGMPELAAGGLAIAQSHKVSAYDGFYLALAQASGRPLVTLDARLLSRLEGSELSGLARLP